MKIKKLIPNHPPCPPFPLGRGNIGEIGDLWVGGTPKTPISPFFPRPLGGGDRGGGIAELHNVRKIFRTGWRKISRIIPHIIPQYPTRFPTQDDCLCLNM
jgi:hypothetical protein